MSGKPSKTSIDVKIRTEALNILRINLIEINHLIFDAEYMLPV